MMMRFFCFPAIFIMLFIIPVYGSDSFNNHDLQESKINNDTIEHSYHIKEKAKKLTSIKKKISNKIQRFLNKKITKFLKTKDDLRFWLWAIVGLLSIISGLIYLGATAWIIIGIVLGLLFVIGFVSYLFVRYLENGFKLEWIWWPILLLILAGFIVGIIFLIGINPVSSLIIGYLLYAVIGFFLIMLFVWLIVAFFKALFSPFAR